MRYHVGSDTPDQDGKTVRQMHNSLEAAKRTYDRFVEQYPHLNWWLFDTKWKEVLRSTEPDKFE